MKCELYNDHFENAKRYNIPRAQLIIADIPYNLGNNAYASDPRWYENGSNKNGESKLAGKSFFDTDNDFKINNFFNFCARLLKKEPKEKGKAPAMIVFHSWQQRDMVIQYWNKKTKTDDITARFQYEGILGIVDELKKPKNMYMD